MTLQPREAAPGRYWMPALVLALGVGSILLLLANNWIQQRLIAPDVGSLRAVAEIQTRVAVTHLWIEEYVTGDEVELDDIDGSLERAERLLRSLQTERGSTGSPFDKRIGSATGRAATDFQRFGALTRERRAAAGAGLDVGIGSPMDVEYDRVFFELDDALGALEQELLLRLTTSERRAGVLFRGLLVAWSLIVILAAVGLWTRERRQSQMAAALDDSQARLLQAQKMESVGQLAGGLAHDINNYLAAISAQSELVKMKAEPNGATARRMDAVLSTTAKAGALIERLLAFSRRQPARPEPVEVNQAIAGLDEMLRQLLGEDVELEIRPGAELSPVVIDLSQLEQIIMNLTVNAREAMTTGGKLTIETANRLEGGAHRVEIAVADTGSGIPKAAREKIFDPFFTTKDQTHSGLGLATVLGIVEQNGGRVAFDTGSRGTRFRVLLPATDAAPAPPPPAAQSEPESPGSGTILLVEDNGDLRRSTSDLLEGWGYEVATAANAHRAIDLFQKAGRRFDLLITDVVMPGMGGRDLAEELHRFDGDLPVLYISGHTDDVVLRHGIEAGEVDLLAKPFTAAELSRRVRAALDVDRKLVSRE